MTDETGAVLRRPPGVQEVYGRDLSILTPFSWLRRGVRDTFTFPVSSLTYGLVIFLISVGFIAALYEFGFSYVLLPSIAGFMVVGPGVAIGLYEKSRLLGEGQHDIGLRDLIMVKAKSPWHLLLVGVFLLLVLLFWLRTAILLYALFYGLRPFVGLEETIETVFFTAKGNTLLLVGSAIGAALAALAFSVSAFSVPMLMNERKDTITAMVVSLLIAWTNKSVVLVWGMLVMTLFILSAATGFVGLIVIFPVLGHATWHAYIAMRGNKALAVAAQETESANKPLSPEH